MKYPKVVVDLNKIKSNTRLLVQKCEKSGIDVAGVTKVFSGYPEIAQAMVEGGVTMIADSRIENLVKLKSLNIPKLLLRLPMISQADEVVKFADISLNSEIETVRKLSISASKIGKKHKIIMMIDLGDLREGIFIETEVFDFVEEVLTLEGIELIGVSTNLTCYGGVMPNQVNLGRLVKLKKEIEEHFNINLNIISGGNSSSVYLLDTGEVPKEINHLRLGESIVLGRETAYGDRIEGTYNDCFKLYAEIIEIKDKPSVPIGEIGMDAFGNKPTFEDKGIIKRAICAVGRQDVDPNNIIPEDNEIEILGASSDHLILDITNLKKTLKIGDKVAFDLTYGGILSTTTSEYLYKETI